MQKLYIILTCLLTAGISAKAEMPSAPEDQQHPGSKIYSYEFEKKDITCNKREVSIFIPKAKNGETFPVLVYGHGQALGLKNYQGTLEHLAKKGIIAVFPTYDTGFFDQDWTRMGRDYVNLSKCAMQRVTNLIEDNQVVFAGHSKGAYVASVAAGIANKEALGLIPRAVVLFEVAGADQATLPYISPATAVTLVFSDHDTVVGRDLTDIIYNSIKSTYKQIINLKSYPGESRVADHFWPLTTGAVFGGGNESSYHYYGEWKWLVASALDLKTGTNFVNPYLYGKLATEKGSGHIEDTVQRSW